MTLKLKYLLPFLLFLNSMKAQQAVEIQKNLVPNGSFENYRKKSGSIRQAIPWSQIASVDYYQESLKNDTSSQKGGRTGDCYIGLRFQKKYKEFAQVKLADALHRGTIYQFDMMEYINMIYFFNIKHLY